MCFYAHTDGPLECYRKVVALRLLGTKAGTGQPGMSGRSCNRNASRQVQQSVLQHTVDGSMVAEKVLDAAIIS